LFEVFYLGLRNKDLTMRNLLLQIFSISFVMAALATAQSTDGPALSPRLFRIILPVDKIDPAVAFYAELLGAPGRRVSPGRHYFDCGPVILAIVEHKADGDAQVARPNSEHIYFAVSDLKTCYERAQRVGGLSTEIGDGNLPMGRIEQRPWGERSFYMRDPFGNPLCFVDERTVFMGR
jgi:catechol 2,3-dioxygenase-like lactoylglutathione lyase family enzyme